jgi:hypothetical protein
MAKVVQVKTIGDAVRFIAASRQQRVTCSDSTAEVFVRVIGGAGEPYRQTSGELMQGHRVRLLAPHGYDASGETWEFPPGAVVGVVPFEVGSGLEARSSFLAVSPNPENTEARKPPR